MWQSWQFGTQCIHKGTVCHNSQNIDTWHVCTMRWRRISKVELIPPSGYSGWKRTWTYRSRERCDIQYWILDLPTLPCSGRAQYQWKLILVLLYQSCLRESGITAFQGCHWVSLPAFIPKQLKGWPFYTCKVSMLVRYKYCAVVTICVEGT